MTVFAIVRSCPVTQTCVVTDDELLGVLLGFWGENVAVLSTLMQPETPDGTTMSLCTLYVIVAFVVPSTVAVPPLNASETVIESCVIDGLPAEPVPNWKGASALAELSELQPSPRHVTVAWLLSMP